ncbi:tunicamycin resistance protein [Sporothrix eucalyptigena]
MVGSNTSTRAASPNGNGHPPRSSSIPPSSSSADKTKAENAALAAGIPSQLSGSETYSLLALAVACATVLGNTVRRDDGAPLTASLALSGIAFSACYAMIRWLSPTFVRAGIKGADLNKVQRRTLPECMGAVCAVVYLLAVIVFIPMPFYKDIVAATSGGGNRDVVLPVAHVEQGRLLHRFPHSKLASFLSAIISLQSITLLGIGDDLFDIRWRHKFFIPAFAAIPLLVVYFVDFGVTSVVVPTPLQPYLGELVHLGPLYYLYMTAVAIFSPNSINILAGINGIEVAQSVVIALLLIFNDALYLLAGPYPHPATDSHLFSLYFLLPFLGVSLALLAHNWFPARVFVGDTYCYFAGMVFVVVSILGHFSKTLILLLLPQIANFVYSAPQIFGLVPCPRHRMPRFNARTGLLEPSVNVWLPDRQPRKPIAWALRVLARLHLLRLTTDPKDPNIIQETTNMTLLNLWLVWRGPMREGRLAAEIVVMQAFVGLFGLFVRHRLALLIFKEDNLGTTNY